MAQPIRCPGVRKAIKWIWHTFDTKNRQFFELNGNIRSALEERLADRGASSMEVYSSPVGSPYAFRLTAKWQARHLSSTSPYCKCSANN